MTQFTNSRLFTEARANIRSIAELCETTKSFGDLHNQIKRSAISVASNIAESFGSTTRPQTRKFLHIARASNHELHAQILIISDLDPTQRTSTLNHRKHHLRREDANAAHSEYRITRGL